MQEITEAVDIWSERVHHILYEYLDMRKLVAKIERFEVKFANQWMKYGYLYLIVKTVDCDI